MAFISVANTALAELVFDVYGQTVENTMWFEASFDPNSTALQDLTDILQTWWADDMKGFMSALLTLNTIRVTSMTSETSPSYERAITTDNQGEVTGDASDSGAAFVIKFNTALRGRSYRGRNYITAIPNSVRDGNDVTSTWANNLVSAYTALSAALVLTGWDHVVVSKFHAGSARSAGVTTPVTSYTYTDLHIDSQRRRLTGRGS